MRYQVSEGAQADLDEIFLYWARRTTVSVADQLMDSIIDRFWLLGEFPDAGKRADDLARGLRCFPAGKYLIYYRKTRRGVEIIHIFHGARLQIQAVRKARKRR